jgi:CRISPR-associated exonuclease Cas4
MLACPIPEGALFYGQIRHRQNVAFDAVLRELTMSAARRFRELFSRRETPPAIYEKGKCSECSLFEICRPRAAAHRVDRYIEVALEVATRAENP